MGKLIRCGTVWKAFSHTWLLHFVRLEMVDLLVLGIGCANGLLPISYAILDHNIALSSIWIHGVTLISTNLLLTISCSRNGYACRALISMTHTKLQELFNILRTHFGWCTVPDLNHLGLRIVVRARRVWWHFLVVPAMVHSSWVSMNTGLMRIRATRALSGGYAVRVFLAHNTLVGNMIARGHSLILNWRTLLLIFPTLIGCIPSEKITRFLEVTLVSAG